MRILLANFTRMVNDSGGLAKVTCAFANEMRRRGHDVSLIYSDVQEGSFFYNLDDGIKTYDLCHFQGQKIVYPISLKVKREILRAFSQRQGRAVNDKFIECYLEKNVKILLKDIRPEIIIASQPAASKVFLCDLRVNIPVITMSHGDPEDYFHTYPRCELPALERSAVCQVLLPAFEKSLGMHLSKTPVVTIGNVVPQYQEQAQLSMDKQQYKAVFSGRLARGHKRPHIIIDAFSRVADQFPEWNIELWGSAEDKYYYKELQHMISKAHLENRIFLKGTTHDISKVLQDSDLFLFPSACEGFPLAMTEAMSMGLPVVGYENCVAVGELIENGVTGFLCKDGVDDFCEKMVVLMKNQSLRVQMGQAARVSMKEYAPEKIWTQWESLIREVV